MCEAALQHSHEPEIQIADELAYRCVLRIDELAAKLAVLTVEQTIADRPDAAARSIPRVEHRHLYSSIHELAGGTHSGESGPGDDDLLQAHDLEEEQRECHV
jgi:hypothetical protein